LKAWKPFKLRGKHSRFKESKTIEMWRQKIEHVLESNECHWKFNEHRWRSEENYFLPGPHATGRQGKGLLANVVK
jgi:hypothetical protein